MVRPWLRFRITHVLIAGFAGSCAIARLISATWSAIVFSVISLLVVGGPGPTGPALSSVSSGTAALIRGVLTER